MILEYLSKVTDLTDVENSIKNYLLNNSSRVEKCNITELADACHVGVASINRFCKKMGYRGYSDFRIAFAKELENVDKINTVLSDEPFNALTSYEEIINHVPYVYEKAIGFAKNAMTISTVNRIVGYLQNSNVLVIGTGVNKLVGEIFCYKMEELGLNAKAMDSIHHQYIDSLRIKKQPMFAILLSHTGKNPAVLQAAEFLHRRGVHSVLICNSVSDEVRSQCSEVIKIIPTLNTKEMSNTQYLISMQYILDVFVAALLVKNYEFVKKVGIDSNYY